ncbi:hypothetical protein D4R49_01185 [bacterium]|nr:MAG: hypothetical protein D4R49_01185 [bacterium]
MDKVKFTVAQVTVLCGGKLPDANGFAWWEVEYFLLGDGILQPYAGKEILPGPGIIFAIREDNSPLDHWDCLARQLRAYMKQLTDERLDMLYHKLFDAGWATPRSFPLSTRNADEEIRHLLMQYVSIETIERREGRVASVK